MLLEDLKPDVWFTVATRQCICEYRFDSAVGKIWLAAKGTEKFCAAKTVIEPPGAWLAGSRRSLRGSWRNSTSGETLWAWIGSTAGMTAARV